MVAWVAIHGARDGAADDGLRSCNIVVGMNVTGPMILSRDPLVKVERKMSPDFACEGNVYKAPATIIHPLGWGRVAIVDVIEGELCSTWDPRGPHVSGPVSDSTSRVDIMVPCDPRVPALNPHAQSRTTYVDAWSSTDSRIETRIPHGTMYPVRDPISGAVPVFATGLVVRGVENDCDAHLMRDTANVM
jgi:hypothetical protein